jgi:hypothetical protein
MRVMAYRGVCFRAGINSLWQSCRNLMKKQEEGVRWFFLNFRQFLEMCMRINGHGYGNAFMKRKGG